MSAGCDEAVCELSPPVGSEEALYLLATCYFRSGKAYKAYRLLKTHTCSTPQCRYLLAKCCVDLSKYEHTHSPQPHSLLKLPLGSLPLTHSESVSHFVTRSLTLSLTYFLSVCLSVSLSLNLSPALSLTLNTFSHSFTHALSLTISFSLSFSHLSPT